MSYGRWFPLRADRKYDRPATGDLIAREHAVWRVEQVTDQPLNDADRQIWLDRGMPDLATWPQRPYRVDVEWIAGKVPALPVQSDGRRLGTMRVPANKYMSWDVYEGGRWPQCSCCGEPMPCRAELEDRQVSASLDRVARFEAIPPGACWACAEPITARQKAVTYPGENLDLPGGQQVHFHTRRGCVRQAQDYEQRWVSADPRRERILTWPRCDGILVVHADGSSECRSGTTLLGKVCESQTGCQGHLTHNHDASIQACYVAYRGMDPSGDWGEGCCPRGCSRDDHPGTQTTPRPARREPIVGHLFEHTDSA